MRTNESKWSKVGEPRFKKCVDVNRTDPIDYCSTLYADLTTKTLFKTPFHRVQSCQRKRETAVSIVDRRTHHLKSFFEFRTFLSYLINSRSRFSFIRSFRTYLSGNCTIRTTQFNPPPYQRTFRKIFIEYSYRIDKKNTRVIIKYRPINSFKEVYSRSFWVVYYRSKLFTVSAWISLVGVQCIEKSRSERTNAWICVRQETRSFHRRKAWTTRERYSYNRCTRLNLLVPLRVAQRS